MPPRADDLYSGIDDSDAESFSDELSPTDGYFAPSQVPSTILVPDQDIDYGPPEAKTLISPPGDAEGSNGRTSRLCHHPRFPQITPSQSQSFTQIQTPGSPGSSQGCTISPIHYTPVSSTAPRRRDASFSEHEQMLYHPPPAYSESPPDSVSSLPSISSPPSVIPSRTFDRNTYSTFPETHLERGFLSRQEPQSMGGPVDEPTEVTALLPKRSKYSPHRRRIKGLLFAALILTVIATTLSIVFGCDYSGAKEKLPSGLYPNYPTNPSKEFLTPYCPEANISHNETFEFSTGRSLNIIQKTHGINEGDDEKGPTSIRTEGEIRLRKAPANSEHGRTPYITVQIGSVGGIHVPMKWSEGSQTLEISTPRYLAYSFPNSACLFLIVTAFLPENSELTNLRFDTTSLNLAITDFKLNVTGSSTFTTAGGQAWLSTEEDESMFSREVANSQYAAVRSKPESVKEQSTLQFSSRRIEVETISGAITGSYPLLDDLLLSSQSGKIDVYVTPKPACKSAPAPADLEVQTASGSIIVNLPLAGSAPLARDYITRVHSTSGTISGTYYLGSESSFKTTSGSISLTGLPVLAKESEKRTSKVPPNLFETHTVSGTTTVTVLDPVFFSGPSQENHDPLPPIFLPAGDRDPYLIPQPTSFLTSTSTSSIIATSISTPIAMPTSLIPPQHNYNPSTKSKLRSLRSAHSSSTGKVSATYPEAWQGTVHGKTVTGSISIQGPGFRTIKSRKGFAFNEVLKRRGVEKAVDGAFVEMNSISGALDFEILGA